MSRLQSDPIREVPRRVLMLAPIFTLIMIVVGLVLDWPALYMIIGYWIGLIANLINFRLIVLGAKNTLDRAENGGRANMMSNLVIRLALSAGALVVAVQLGLHAFVCAIIGVSMVRFAIQTDGFFTFGYTKEK